MADEFRYERPARRPAGYAMVGLGLALLLALIFVFDAHPLLIAVTALAVSPALYEIIRGTNATLRVDDNKIAWTSGTRAGEVPLNQIDTARLATTLDFSQRATLILKNGTKLRLPPESLPPGRALDGECEKRGIAHRRSLFSF
ncbi:MAG: hypothetical protein AAGK37_05940 [Pseudomonadota bacterium]